MAPKRPYWKGYLKLSLVTCPVAMTPATSETEKIRFHTLNKQTGNRVVSRFVDSVTGKPVPQEKQVKGFERSEDDYVILSDKELESVELETVRTIEIEKFVSRDSIDLVYMDTPHYLVPNEKIGNEAFAVIRDAMKADDVVGIARLVIGRRERAVLLEPRDAGIVLWTLRFGDELRPEGEYFQSIDKKADPKAVVAIKKLIKPRLDKWSPEMVSDPIQRSLIKLIASKKKSAKSVKPNSQKTAASNKGSNVIDIMDALKKSVAAELASRKKAG